MNLIEEILMVMIQNIALVLLLVFFLGLYFLVTFATARDIIYRILWKRIRGKELLFAANPDGTFDLPFADKEGRWLRGNKAEYDIYPGSILRGKEFDIYFVNSALGRTLRPDVIKAANNLRVMGYSNLAHALLTYQGREHEDDYNRIVKAGLENKENNVAILLEEFDKKVYASLMDPMKRNTDYTTQNLAILNEWSNQNLSAYENKDIVEHEKLMTLREQKLGGLPLEKLLGYGAFFAIIVGAVGFLIVILKSQGML